MYSYFKQRHLLFPRSYRSLYSYINIHLTTPWTNVLFTASHIRTDKAIWEQDFHLIILMQVYQ